MAEFERIEKVSHLRIFTHNIKIRKFMISCCDYFTVHQRNKYSHILKQWIALKACSDWLLIL